MPDEQRFWRVYSPEWCVMYVSDTDGIDGEQECRQQFDEQYKGRIRPDDWRLLPWHQTSPGDWPWVLALRLPVMKGEYCGRPHALNHAHDIDGEVVLEGSRTDKKLQGYGRHMLKEGFVDNTDANAADGPARGAESQEGRAGA